MAWDYQQALISLMASYDEVANARSIESQAQAKTEFLRQVSVMRNAPCPETHALLDELVDKLENRPRARVVSPTST